MNRLDIDTIKAKSDIVEVISDYVALEPDWSQINFKGFCPFHTEKTPSFVVSREKQFYHCFGCGANGDVFKFIQLLLNYNFKKTLEFLDGKFDANPETIRLRKEKIIADAKEAKMKQLAKNNARVKRLKSGYSQLLVDYLSDRKYNLKTFLLKCEMLELDIFTNWGYLYLKNNGNYFSRAMLGQKDKCCDIIFNQQPIFNKVKCLEDIKKEWAVNNYRRAF